MRAIIVTMISLLALFGLYASAEVSVDDLLRDILKCRGSYEAAKQNLKEANKQGLCPEDEDLLNLYRIIINGCSLRDDNEERYNAIAGKFISSIGSWANERAPARIEYGNEIEGFALHGTLHSEHSAKLLADLQTSDTAKGYIGSVTIQDNKDTLTFILERAALGDKGVELPKAIADVSAKFGSVMRYMALSLLFEQWEERKQEPDIELLTDLCRYTTMLDEPLSLFALIRYNPTKKIALLTNFLATSIHHIEFGDHDDKEGKRPVLYTKGSHVLINGSEAFSVYKDMVANAHEHINGMKHYARKDNGDLSDKDLKELKKQINELNNVCGEAFRDYRANAVRYWVNRSERLWIAVNRLHKKIESLSHAIGQGLLARVQEPVQCHEFDQFFDRKMRIWLHHDKDSNTGEKGRKFDPKDHFIVTRNPSWRRTETKVSDGISDEAILFAALPYLPITDGLLSEMCALGNPIMAYNDRDKHITDKYGDVWVAQALSAYASLSSFKPIDKNLIESALLHKDRIEQPLLLAVAVELAAKHEISTLYDRVLSLEGRINEMLREDMRQPHNERIFLSSEDGNLDADLRTVQTCLGIIKFYYRFKLVQYDNIEHMVDMLLSYRGREYPYARLALYRNLSNWNNLIQHKEQRQLPPLKYQVFKSFLSIDSFGETAKALGKWQSTWTQIYESMPEAGEMFVDIPYFIPLIFGEDHSLEPNFLRLFDALIERKTNISKKEYYVLPSQNNINAYIEILASGWYPEPKCDYEKKLHSEIGDLFAANVLSTLFSCFVRLKSKVDWDCVAAVCTETDLLKSPIVLYRLIQLVYDNKAESLYPIVAKHGKAVETDAEFTASSGRKKMLFRDGPPDNSGKTVLDKYKEIIALLNKP